MYTVSMPSLERLIAIMAPHRCVVCGSEGNLLCAWCVPEAFPRLPSRCFKCQKFSPDCQTCVKCRRHTCIKHVWTVTAYAGAAIKLLHSFKFERASSAGLVVAKAIADNLPFLPPETIIIPVPTATKRIRQRGYDHAEIIAGHLAKDSQLAWARSVSRLTQSRQVGASRAVRKRQLKNAFFIPKPSLLRGSQILIVDDVVTTGATLEAMAIELKRAGAKTINAAVFTQKL